VVTPSSKTFAKESEKRMTDEAIKIVEIGGVKMALDMRQATVQSVDTFRVGDSVKVLIKDYTGYKDYAGVIAGFDAFKARPTIIVAYLDVGYSEATLKSVYINQDTEDTEICLASGQDVPFERDTVLKLMDRKITATETALQEARIAKERFLSMFNRYFGEYAEVEAAVNAATEEIL